MMRAEHVIPNPLSQGMILSSFVGFQALDAFTTHIGLAFHHAELNRLMAPLIASHGELVAYAVKGLAVASLLAILMLLEHHKPRVWHAYRVAALVTAIAVVFNVAQLVG
jgi:hypothetical protein